MAFWEPARSKDRPASLRRTCRIATVVCIGLLGVVYAVAWPAPAVGLYHDDGVYLVTAKALAEGKGYQIISLPHPIPQTKYPFLFPAALSVVWRLFPDFPHNVMLLKAVPLACTPVWLCLAYLLLLRLRATTVQALWTVLLTAAAPPVIFLSTNLMSETMFAALFTAALLAAHKVERAGSVHWAWAAGSLAALAFLTRTAGIAILVGIPLAFAVERRFGAVWRFLGAGAALSCVWPAWVRTHAGFPDATQLYYSSANYSSWNILTNYAIPEKLYILGRNVLLSLVAPVSLMDVRTSLWQVFPAAAVLFLLFARKLVRCDAVHLSLAAYLGVILCWAWPPSRFIVVILPVVLFLIWKVVEAVTPRRALRYSALALVGALSCSLLVNDLRRIPQVLSGGQFPVIRGTFDRWRDLEDVFAWLRANTPPDAVVLANLDPACFLYTGRKSTRNLIADSYKLFYAPDAPAGDAVAPLETLIRASGASFLVMTPDRLFAESRPVHQGLQQFIASHPGKLERIERPGADPEFQIYRIQR